MLKDPSQMTLDEIKEEIRKFKSKRPREYDRLLTEVYRTLWNGLMPKCTAELMKESYRKPESKDLERMKSLMPIYVMLSLNDTL